MQWICNIALFLVLSGIILEMIADTKYYKFARWVSGVILLMQFLQPMTKVEELWSKYTMIFSSFDYALGTDKVLEEIYQVDGQTENTVLGEYKETIAKQIDRMLNSSGLKMVQADISVAGDGTIEHMFVQAVYLDGTKEQEILIPTVAPVRIGEGQEKKVVSPLELYIRNMLAEFYQMDENKIEVVIQEAE